MTSEISAGSDRAICGGVFPDEGDVELLAVAIRETMAAIVQETGLDERDIAELLDGAGKSNKDFARIVRQTVSSVASRTDVDPEELAHVISHGGSVEDILARLRASRTWGLHAPGNA